MVANSNRDLVVFNGQRHTALTRIDRYRAFLQSPKGRMFLQSKLAFLENATHPLILLILSAKAPQSEIAGEMGLLSPAAFFIHLLMIPMHQMVPMLSAAGDDDQQKAAIESAVLSYTILATLGLQPLYRIYDTQRLDTLTSAQRDHLDFFLKTQILQLFSHWGRGLLVSRNRVDIAFLVALLSSVLQVSRVALSDSAQLDDYIWSKLYYNAGTSLCFILALAYLSSAKIVAVLQRLKNLKLTGVQLFHLVRRSLFSIVNAYSIGQLISQKTTLLQQAHLLGPMHTLLSLSDLLKFPLAARTVEIQRQVAGEHLSDALAARQHANQAMRFTALAGLSLPLFYSMGSQWYDEDARQFITLMGGVEHLLLQNEVSTFLLQAVDYNNVPNSLNVMANIGTYYLVHYLSEEAQWAEYSVLGAMLLNTTLRNLINTK